MPVENISQADLPPTSAPPPPAAELPPAPVEAEPAVVEESAAVEEALKLDEEVPAAAATVEAEDADEVVESDVPEVAGAAPGAVPRKRIERVNRLWEAEDQSHLSVSENEFINTWVDTATDHGWIHAERRTNTDNAQVGWLPVCVIQSLPDQQRWMTCKQQWQATDESQCTVGDGSCVIVWVSSRTPEGWTYAEAEDSSGNMKPGWLPVFCLEWQED
jgi:hypothetical protein